MTEKEMYEKGRAAYLEATRREPGNSENWRNLAQAQMMLGEIEAAIDSNIEALRLEPTSEWALTLMGNLYCRFRNDLKTGEEYYRRAVAAHPKSGLALCNLAAALATGGRPAEAVEYFYKSLEVDDRNLNAWCGLATCFTQQRMYDSAYRAAKKGLEFGKMLSADDAQQLMVRLELIVVNATQHLEANGEMASADRSLREDLDERKRERQRQFDEVHKGGGGVAMTLMMQSYMLAAMETYETMTPEQVKQAAIQFSVQGQKGYSVGEDAKYSIPALPGKVMSGYQTLAYYYVAMAQAFPQLLPELKLPFEKAYEMAKSLRIKPHGCSPN